MRSLLLRRCRNDLLTSAVGAVAAHTDVWAGDPAKAYGRICNVYRAIIENFGTTGFGARMLTGIFDVPLPWFPAWEARNVEEAASGTAAVTQEIGDVRAVAGETDAGAEAALAAAAALQQQAVSLRSNVDDFLQTIRAA